MLHHPDFYRAIALGIDAENQKASVYINHATSIGTAREIILRDVLVDTTPEPYKLGTGLIHGNVNGQDTTSRQCDVLIYNPTINPPKYSFDNFVVVEPGTANVIVEVKSNLNDEAFNQALDIMESTWQFSIPTLTFAYDSVLFDTLVQYFSTAAADPDRVIPWCTAAHANNFVAVRPRTVTNGHQRYDLLIDCSAADETHDGIATALFLQFYNAWLRDRGILSSANLYGWYNSLNDIPDAGRVYIAEDGQVNHGAIT